MTQYLLAVHTGADSADSAEMSPDSPDAQRMYAQVDVLNAELRDSGSWVFAGGLHPAAVATTVRPSGGDVLVTDGPYAESKEHLGGFWIIDVADLDAALAWAKKAAVACEGPVEVRPFQGE